MCTLTYQQQPKGVTVWTGQEKACIPSPFSACIKPADSSKWGLVGTEERTKPAKDCRLEMGKGFQHGIAD